MSVPNQVPFLFNTFVLLFLLKQEFLHSQISLNILFIGEYLPCFALCCRSTYLSTHIQNNSAFCTYWVLQYFCED